jgi:hypothetical protein
VRIRELSLLLLVSLAAPGRRLTDASRCEPTLGRTATRREFEAVMHGVAAGWNANDAGRAASCFTDDARYSAVPDARVRRGRDELFRWFGGAKGRPKPMHMEWHHLVFDPEQQIGVGEYTFDYETRSHGLVIVRLRSGLIANWREYEHESRRAWRELVAGNDF